MSLDSGAHYTFMMLNYRTFTIQMKFHEEGDIEKNAVRERERGRVREREREGERSLASLHFSASLSLSLYSPLPSVLFLFFFLPLPLCPLVCLFLTYHSSAPCGPSGHHITSHHTAPGSCLSLSTALSQTFLRHCLIFPPPFKRHGSVHR